MAGSMPNGIAYDDNGWHDAGLDAHRAWLRYRDATTPIGAAEALIDLGSAMFDLSTWLPGFDGEHGEVTDPRDVH